MYHLTNVNRALEEELRNEGENRGNHAGGQAKLSPVASIGSKRNHHSTNIDQARKTTKHILLEEIVQKLREIAKDKKGIPQTKATKIAAHKMFNNEKILRSPSIANTHQKKTQHKGTTSGKLLWRKKMMSRLQSPEKRSHFRKARGGTDKRTKDETKKSTGTIMSEKRQTLHKLKERRSKKSKIDLQQKVRLGKRFEGSNKEGREMKKKDEKNHAGQKSLDKRSPRMSERVLQEEIGKLLRHWNYSECKITFLILYAPQ